MSLSWPSHAAKPGRVVVIDDDPDVLDSLGMVLEHAGHRCDRYADGIDFLKTLREGYQPIERRACILSDVKMPTLGGLALQRQLYERSNIPLIMMSGACSPQDVVDAFHGGVVDFLIKPFNNAELLAKVDRALTLSDKLVSERRLEIGLGERLRRLTLQEREIARRVAEGQSSSRISQDLGIAIRTVKLHRSRMMEKLGLESVEAFLNVRSLLQL